MDLQTFALILIGFIVAAILIYLTVDAYRRAPRLRPSLFSDDMPAPTLDGVLDRAETRADEQRHS